MKRTVPPYALHSEQNPRYKPRNEDAAAATVLRNRAGRLCLAGVVADGVSGLPQGDEAARLAVRQFLAELRAGTFSTAADLAALAPALLNRVNRPIRELGDSGAGCTFTAAVVIGGGVVIIHLGDSSCAYFGRDDEGGLTGRRLTQEHTLVAAAAAGGASDEALDAMHQHAIDRCLGDPEVSPQVILDPPGVTATRGRLLLATDGVTDVWTQGELLALAGREPDAAKACRDICGGALARTNPRGKPNKDNITCVILELAGFTAATQEQEALAGAAAPQPVRPVGGRRDLLRLWVLGAVGALALGLFTTAGIIYSRQGIEKVPSANKAVEVKPLPPRPAGGGRNGEVASDEKQNGSETFSASFSISKGSLDNQEMQVSAAASATTPIYDYRVKSGDEFDKIVRKIAKRDGEDFKELRGQILELEGNEQLKANPAKLGVGQVIKLPVPGPE